MMFGSVGECPGKVHELQPKTKTKKQITLIHWKVCIQTANKYSSHSSWSRSERRRQDEHQRLSGLHQGRPAAHRPDEVQPPRPARLHRGPLHGRSASVLSMSPWSVGSLFTENEIFGFLLCFRQRDSLSDRVSGDRETIALAQVCLPVLLSVELRNEFEPPAYVHFTSTEKNTCFKVQSS